jgi:hypothetical protein
MDRFRDIDLTISSLLDEIAHIQERIADLRTRRNSLMPIFRLPREVLGHIFYLYQADTYIQQETSDFSLFNPLALRLPDVRWLENHFRLSSFPRHSAKGDHLMEFDRFQLARGAC